MSSLNSDSGSHAGTARRREELAEGYRAPVTGAKTTVKLCNPTGETTEERRARHAATTGTRKSLWK